MFEVTVNTRRAVVGSKEPITTSSAGILVQFTFSEDWDGLSRFAIFRNGEDMNKIPVALPNSNLVTIPAQSCAEEYIDEPLFVGVYGSDGVGTVIIPTVWASLGVLREGAVTTEIITPAEPTPDMWAQILAIANEAAAIADECEENEELRVAAEQMRADAETARVNAETLRAQAEVERSGNEAQRQSAETQRQIDEDARAQAETLRIQAEELRKANETSRVSAESTRASNERSRQSHERERESVESLRGIRETERINAEWDRQNAETARASAEISRADAESSRATAEQNRASAETARASAESARSTAESTRASNEQSRVSAEDGRVQAETDRATEFATWESTIASKVPNARTVNGKALSTDITLDSSDIGYDATETYQSGTAGAALNDLNRQISDVESATSALDGELFDKDPVDIFYTQNNYALTSTGLYVRDYNAITEEYYVGDCSELYVEIANKGNFGGVYIFQSIDRSPPSSGTNANLVGEVGISAFTGILTVPIGALYMYVTKTADTENVIAKVARKYITKEAFDGDIASTQSLIGSTADLNSYITNNYKLISGGLSERDYSADTQTYTLDVNDVYLYLDVEKYSDVTFFFQSRSNFPPASGINANIVGDIHNTAFKGVIEVPRGAKYLFVSQRKNTANVVKKYNYSVVKSLKAYDIVNLNAFQQSAIQQSRRRLNDGENKYLTYTPILSFLHFSDLHKDAVNLARIMEFYNAYENYIDDIISSGDQVDLYTDGLAWWNVVSGTDKILTCVGNHEVVYVENNVAKHDTPQADVYQTYLAPYINNWGVNYTSGLCYYYKDYPTNNVRLIVLDCMLSYLAGTDDTDQLAWFAERLSEAKTNGYSVVVMEHYPAGAVREAVECNFTDEVGEYGSGIGAAYQNAVQSFIDGGGDFVCYIAGHVHFDTIHYNEVYPSQLFVCVANAGVAEQYSDFSREYNTKSQDCFNIISIDTHTKTLKLVRIGADFDNYLRHRGTLCINYATKNIISES